MKNSCKSVSQTQRIGTARMKYDKETDEEGTKRDVSTERSKAGTKKRTDDLSPPNQNKLLINIIWYYFIRYGKIAMKFN